MKLLTILTTVNSIFAINTRLDPSSTDECTTKTGTVIPAGNFRPFIGGTTLECIIWSWIDTH